MCHDQDQLRESKFDETDLRGPVQLTHGTESVDRAQRESSPWRLDVKSKINLFNASEKPPTALLDEMQDLKVQGESELTAVTPVGT